MSPSWWRSTSTMTAVEILQFARGPALWASLAVLVAGSLWRVLGILRLGSTPDLSEPRSSRLLAGSMRGIFARMLPRKEFRHGRDFSIWNAYAYHVGLAVIVFGYLPHIHFVERLTGLAWPALPEPVTSRPRSRTSAGRRRRAGTSASAPALCGRSCRSRAARRGSG